MNGKKKWSFILVGVLFVSLISNIMIKANATVNNKPIFDVEVSVTPNPAKVGQDITVSGVIKPQPFEIEIPRREVVLVLDVSYSMMGSRLTKLKNAANSFIDKMKDVPNLKIGIVTYSTSAQIKEATIGGKSTTLIPSTNVSELKQIINELNVDRLTNIGEGLRKGQYLLSAGSNDANKTVILMSDGLPTAYSLKSDNKSFYTSIDNLNPKTEGVATNSLVEKAREYALLMGGSLKSSVNSIFSIGYELGTESSQGNRVMREIHQSMGGLESNFFATSEGAIDSVMQKIATNIIDTYTISNIKLNLNIINEITLYAEDNAIEINEVIYKKVSEANGKVRYEAGVVPFSFVISGKQEVQEYSLFQNSNITYPWNNESLTVSIPETRITIIEEKDIPKLEVTLKSASNVIATAEEEVDVTYTITPEEFNYMLNISSEGDSKQIKEAIFLVDLSKSMKNNDILSYVGRWIENVLLNDSNLKKRGIKFGMIGYADKSIYPGNNKDAYYKLFDISRDKNIFKQFINSNNGLLNATEINTRNVGAAISDADKLFDTQGDPNAGKAIILISSGKVSYSQSEISSIKDKGYKIISLYLDLQDGAQDSVNNYEFKVLHNAIRGIEEEYYISSEKGKNYNSLKIDMDKVLLSLLKGVNNSVHSPYVFNDVKLNFDLNGNFRVISGLTSNGSGYVYNVPQIMYTATSRNDDGTYKYIASPFDISFKVKAISGKSGELSFGINPIQGSQEYEDKLFKNYISYTKIDKTLAKMPIDTPIITIGTSDIQHGVYEGIKNNPPIYTGSPRDFAKGSNITMAALFKTIRNDTDIGLTVSPSLTVKGNINVYKVLNNGNLQFIANMTVSNNNVYSYNLNADPGTKILVLYNVTVPTNIGTYTNTIYVGPETKDAVIKVQDISLPDLF